jgi:hypothetical protein
MDDGDSVTEHLNYFNTLVSKLVSINIMIAEEDKCITLLCSFPYSWDNLFVAVGSTTQSTLKYDDVVSSLLSEEMRWKNMDSHNIYTLSIRGHPQYRNKNKFSWGDLNLKVDRNPQKHLRGNVVNLVKLGII